jgi:hypothetical protein
MRATATSVSLDEAVALIDEFGPNCLLGICCPPASQRDVLAAAIAKTFARDVEPANAKLIAHWLLDHFDLVPKDSITPLLQLAGKLVRED